MASGITINFQQATSTAVSLQVLVSDGSFVLEFSQGVSVLGSAGIGSVYLTSGGIGFSAPVGSPFNATIQAQLEASGSSTPTILANNFSGMTTVTWPTAEGLQTQMLMAGDPLPLNGFRD